MTVKHFDATVTRVIDGDTIKLSVRLRRSRGKDTDYGFSVYRKNNWLVLHYTFRLLGCNAWEHGTPAGDAATAHLKEILPAGTLVGVSSVSNDKYSRYDAAITLPDGADLVTGLTADQWVAPWNGKGARPLPPWPRTDHTQAGPEDGA